MTILAFQSADQWKGRSQTLTHKFKFSVVGAQYDPFTNWVVESFFSGYVSFARIVKAADSVFFTILLTWTSSLLLNGSWITASAQIRQLTSPVHQSHLYSIDITMIYIVLAHSHLMFPSTNHTTTNQQNKFPNFEFKRAICSLILKYTRILSYHRLIGYLYVAAW